jgi:hypothetical protein
MQKTGVFPAENAMFFRRDDSRSRSRQNGAALRLTDTLTLR